MAGETKGYVNGFPCVTVGGVAQGDDGAGGTFADGGDILAECAKTLALSGLRSTTKVVDYIWSSQATIGNPANFHADLKATDTIVYAKRLYDGGPYEGGGVFYNMGTGYGKDDDNAGGADEHNTYYGLDYVIGGTGGEGASDGTLFKRQCTTVIPEMWGAANRGFLGSNASQTTWIARMVKACTRNENSSYATFTPWMSRGLKFFVPMGQYVITSTVRLIYPKFPFTMEGQFFVPYRSEIVGVQVAFFYQTLEAGGFTGTDSSTILFPLQPVKLNVTKGVFSGKTRWVNEHGLGSSYTFNATSESYGPDISETGLIYSEDEQDALRLKYATCPDVGVELLHSWQGDSLEIENSDNFCIGLAVRPHYNYSPITPHCRVNTGKVVLRRANVSKVSCLVCPVSDETQSVNIPWTNGTEYDIGGSGGSSGDWSWPLVRWYSGSGTTRPSIGTAVTWNGSVQGHVQSIYGTVSAGAMIFRPARRTVNYTNGAGTPPVDGNTVTFTGGGTAVVRSFTGSSFVAEWASGEYSIMNGDTIDFNSSTWTATVSNDPIASYSAITGTITAPSFSATMYAAGTTEPCSRSNPKGISSYGLLLTTSNTRATPHNGYTFKWTRTGGTANGTPAPFIETLTWGTGGSGRAVWVSGRGKNNGSMTIQATPYWMFDFTRTLGYQNPVAGNTVTWSGGGSGSGIVRYISSAGATGTMYVETNGSSMTDAATITYGSYSGTHNGSDNASVLTDTTKSWTVNGLVGCTVNNLTDGSSGTITANTATTVTATLSGGTGNDWDATGGAGGPDSYTITPQFQATVDNGTVSLDTVAITDSDTITCSSPSWVATVDDGTVTGKKTYNTGDRVSGGNAPRNANGQGPYRYVYTWAGSNGATSHFPSHTLGTTNSWTYYRNCGGSSPNGNTFTGGMQEGWHRTSTYQPTDSGAILLDRGGANTFESYRVEHYSQGIPFKMVSTDGYQNNRNIIRPWIQGYIDDYTDEYYASTGQSRTPVHNGRGNRIEPLGDLLNDGGEPENLRYQSPLRLVASFKASECLFSSYDRIYLPRPFCADNLFVSSWKLPYVAATSTDGYNCNLVPNYTALPSGAIRHYPSFSYNKNHSWHQTVCVYLKINHVCLQNRVVLKSYDASGSAGAYWITLFDSSFTRIDPHGIRCCDSTTTAPLDIQGYPGGVGSYYSYQGDMADGDSFSLIPGTSLTYLMLWRVGSTSETASKYTQWDIFTQGIECELYDPSGSSEIILQNDPASGWLEKGRTWSLESGARKLVTASGWAASATNNGVWQNGATYYRNEIIENVAGDKYYKCKIGGTSTVEPSAGTNPFDETTVGGVTWWYLGGSTHSLATIATV